MMPTRTGLGLLLTLLTVALSLFSPAACYNPSIQDGGFLCAEAGKQCPDGFVCADRRKVPRRPPPRSARSRRSRRSAAINRVTGAACNPTCQTGCACGRCNVSGAAPACVTDVGTKKLGEICTPSKDDCQPGYICLLEADTCGQNVGRCYQYCTTNAQCASPVAGRTCEIPILDSNNNDTEVPRRAAWARRRATRWRRPATAARAPGSAATSTPPARRSATAPTARRRSCSAAVHRRTTIAAAGLICTPSAGLAGMHCRQICMTSGTNTCPSGQHCMTVADGTVTATASTEGASVQLSDRPSAPPPDLTSRSGS